MEKVKVRNISRKAASILLFSIILFGIGLLIALLISSKSGQKLYDILTYEGLLIIIIGILLAMKGNPSGINISGIGSENAQGISYHNLEVTRAERENQPYHKNFLKSNILQFKYYHIALLVSGLMMIAACLIMIYCL